MICAGTRIPAVGRCRRRSHLRMPAPLAQLGPARVDPLARDEVQEVLTTIVRPSRSA